MSRDVIGWVGTALVLVAYIPQIRHLYVERCAWGINVWTWVIWLVASVCLLTYSILRRDSLFVAAQAVNAVAVVATLVLTRRSNRICPRHCSPGMKARGAA